MWSDDCDHGLTLDDDDGIVVATRWAVSSKLSLMGSQAPVTHVHDQSIEQRDCQKQRVTKECEWCDMMVVMMVWRSLMMRELLLLLLRHGEARHITKTLPFRFSGAHNRLCKENCESKERQERDTRQCEWWDAPYWGLWLICQLWMMREFCVDVARQ